MRKAFVALYFVLGVGQAAFADSSCLKATTEIDLGTELPSAYDQGESKICYSIASSAGVSAAIQRESHESAFQISQAWALAQSLLHGPATVIEDRVELKAMDPDFGTPDNLFFDFGWPNETVAALIRSGELRESVSNHDDLARAESLSGDLTYLLPDLVIGNSDFAALEKRATREAESIRARDTKLPDLLIRSQKMSALVGSLRYGISEYWKDNAFQEANRLFFKADNDKARAKACEPVNAKIVTEIMEQLCNKVPLVASIDVKGIEVRAATSPASESSWRAKKSQYEHVAVLRGLAKMNGKSYFVLQNSEHGEEWMRVPLDQACRVTEIIWVLGPHDPGYEKLRDVAR